jgi:hydroxypyruvate reductase
MAGGAPHSRPGRRPHRRRPGDLRDFRRQFVAACHPAKVVTLLISDVSGDDPSDIASGPTTADRTTCADALAILRRYAIDVPDKVRALIESGRGESVKPGDARLANSETRMIATPQMALEAAAAVARAAGVPAHILGASIEGEARHQQPFAPPCILLSGGETTVTVRGDGRGGRDVEFLLSLGVTLNGEPGIHAMACDTDGVDGQEEIAGAYLAQWGRSYNLTTFSFAGVLGPSRAKPCRAPSSRF